MRAATLRDDNIWAAPFLLAAFLRAATLAEPLDATRAQQLLDAQRDRPRTPQWGELEWMSVEQLAERGWIRFVLGQVEIPQGVIRALHGAEDDRLPSTARASLSVLYKGRHVEKSRCRIERRAAHELRERHAALFPSTPTLEQLVERGVLSPIEETPGAFSLRVKDRDQNAIATSWSRAAALHWEHLVRDAEPSGDIAKLRSWLTAMVRTEWWDEVPSEMVPDLRARFLDAALALLLAEPDLRGWAEELGRLRWESEQGLHPRWRLPPPPVGPDISSAVRYAWWSEIEKWFEGESALYGTRCRSVAHRLVLAIALHDEERAPGSTRHHARIRTLIDAGDHLPYLSLAAPADVLHQRPDAIPTLLLAVRTASLGVALLGEAQLPDPRWTVVDDGTPAPGEQAFEACWREAMGLALRTLVRCHDTAAATLALAEILLPLADAATRGSGWSRFEPARRRANARLEAALTQVEATRLSHTVHLGAGLGFHPSWLLHIASHLHRVLAARAEMREHPAVADLPFAEARLLLWLLRYIDRSTAMEREHAELKELISPTIAATLVDIHRTQMDREVLETESEEGGTALDVVSWSDEIEWATELPWSDLVVILVRERRLDRFLRPVDFGARVSELAQVAARVDRHTGVTEETVMWRLEHAWTAKLRTHVMALIHAHAGLVGEATETALTPALRDQAVTAIEEEISTILISYGGHDSEAKRLWLFERNQEYPIPVGRPTPPLLPRVVEAINRFGHEHRGRVIRDWVDRTDDPATLFTLAQELAPASGREYAQQRLARIDWSSYLAQEHWLDQIERVVTASAQVGPPEVTEQLLAHGDRITERHSYRTRWAATAFRARLMLAFKRRDLDAVESLILPPESDAPHNERASRRALESSRTFYRALLLIEEHPDRAHELFDRLVKQDPHAVAAAVNRFAAKVKAARGQEDGESRRQGILLALAEWDAFASAATGAELTEVSDTVSYNRLLALDGLGLVERFDKELGELPVWLRCQPAYLRVALESFRRRGQPSRVESALDEAKAYHPIQASRASGEILQLEHEFLGGGEPQPPPEPRLVAAELVPERPLVAIFHVEEDVEWLHVIRPHLGVLQQEGVIDLWDRMTPSAGSILSDEVSSAIERARVAVLLVSAPFLNDDWARNDVLPALLLRAARGELRLLPLVVRPCPIAWVTQLARYAPVNDVGLSFAELSVPARDRLIVERLIPQVVPR